MHNEPLREELNQLFCSVKSSVTGISNVLLFGSNARGNAAPSSDIDILCVFDNDHIGNINELKHFFIDRNMKNIRVEPLYKYAKFGYAKYPSSLDNIGDMPPKGNLHISFCNTEEIQYNNALCNNIRRDGIML